MFLNHIKSFDMLIFFASALALRFRRNPKITFSLIVFECHRKLQFAGSCTNRSQAYKRPGPATTRDPCLAASITNETLHQQAPTKREAFLKTGSDAADDRQRHHISWWF